MNLPLVVPTCKQSNADKRGRAVEQWRQDEARQELGRLQKSQGKPGG